jgi:Spy/CpxP family protein refolding chaperone
MRTWIAIFSVALFAGGTCLGVALQPKLKPPTPVLKPVEPAPTRYFDRISVHDLASKLDLSGEQNTQLEQILAETQIILEANGRSIRAAHDHSREQVMALLTDEQKKKLDDLLAAERQKRAESEAEKTVKTYSKLLELTPEQSKGFRDAVVEAKNKKRDYFGSHKHGGDHDQSRTFFRSVREDQNKAIEKALTPEQYQRYLEMSELER